MSGGVVRRKSEPKAWVMPNGKHAGQPITRVPQDYLVWMVAKGHTEADRARAELDRRGTKVPEVDVTLHSIDRASQRLLSKWQEDCPNREPGIATWLADRAAEVLRDGRPVGGENEEDRTRVETDRFRFVFDLSGQIPRLLTVLHVRKKESDE